MHIISHTIQILLVVATSILSEERLLSDAQRLLHMSRNLDVRADFPSTLLPLHAAPKPDFLVQNELPDHLHPAVVTRQVAVEFIGDLVELPQTCPRHGGEVVVLVVQADVVREQVQRAVVRERLRRRGEFSFLALFVRLLQGARVLGEDVMLGDEVACDWVQRAGEEGAQDEVAEGFATYVLYEEVIDNELYGDVEGVDASEGQVVDHHWAEGVEEDLEGREEGLAGDGIKEPCFEGGGEVGVESINAEGLVVG